MGKAIELIDEVEARMVVLAQAKALKLTTHLAADLPATLYGDPQRLEQIIVNLVGNAIKFTESGSIILRVCRPDKGHWAIKVSDTGPGIPPEAQTRIFEPFRQVDGSVTRLHKGTGLGLSIVKQLTSMMDGQIELDSQLGKGSTFSVILPIMKRKPKT